VGDKTDNLNNTDGKMGELAVLGMLPHNASDRTWLCGQSGSYGAKGGFSMHVVVLISLVYSTSVS